MMMQKARVASVAGSHSINGDNEGSNHLTEFVH